MTTATDTAPRGVVVPALVTPAEAETAFRVSAAVLREAWRRGELHRYGPPGGHVTYDAAEILRWLKRRATEPNPKRVPTKHERVLGLPGTRRRW